LYKKRVLRKTLMKFYEKEKSFLCFSLNRNNRDCLTEEDLKKPRVECHLCIGISSLVSHLIN